MSTLSSSRVPTLLFVSHEPNHRQPPNILPNHAALPRFLPLVAARRPGAACLRVFAPAVRLGATSGAGEGGPAAWGLSRHGGCCAGGLTTTGASSDTHGSAFASAAAAAGPAAGPPRSAEPRRSRGSEASGLSGPPKQPGLPAPLELPPPPLAGVLRGAGVCSPRSRVPLQGQRVDSVQCLDSVPGCVDSRCMAQCFNSATVRGTVLSTKASSFGSSTQQPDSL
jgi:hypothetical protein